jgi:hypothetical protein
VRKLELNRKLFPDRSPFILHGALVGAGLPWSIMHYNTTYNNTKKNRHNFLQDGKGHIEIIVEIFHEVLRK